MREVFGSEQGLHLLYHDVMNRKTIARLREIVTGAAPVAPEAADSEETAVEAPAETPVAEEAVGTYRRCLRAAASRATFSVDYYVNSRMVGPA